MGVYGQSQTALSDCVDPACAAPSEPGKRRGYLILRKYVLWSVVGYQADSGGRLPLLGVGYEKVVRAAIRCLGGLDASAWWWMAYSLRCIRADNQRRQRCTIPERRQGMADL